MNAVNELKGSYPHIDFQLRRVPFFLEPGYIKKSPDFQESHEERMIRKFGSLEAFNQVKAAHGLIPRGAEVGLDASVGFTQEQLDLRVQSSTLASHRLVLYVTEKCGMTKAEAFYDALNQEHFLKAGVLNDYSLLESCLKVVLSKEELPDALEYLHSTRGVKETLFLYQKTQELGVSSIPTLVIDGRFMVSGAAQAGEIFSAIKDAIDSGPTGSRAFAAPSVLA